MKLRPPPPLPNLRRSLIGLMSLCIACGSPPRSAQPAPNVDASAPLTAAGDASVMLVQDAADAGEGEGEAPMDATASKPTGIDAHEPELPVGRCEAEKLGGWTGTPMCRARAALTIPGRHKRCKSSEDCVLIGGSCNPHAIHVEHERSYDSRLPCGNPRAGACADRFTAVCRAGCCTLSDKAGSPAVW